MKILSKTAENLIVWALAVLLMTMVGTFFACGDDDDDDNDSGTAADDDDDSDDEDLASASCETLLANFTACLSLDTTGSISSRVAPDFDSDCFIAWCNGGGYDTVGNLFVLEFNRNCYPSRCSDFIDIYFSANNPNGPTRSECAVPWEDCPF
ncbi:MAG: hypothetical protein H6684_16775 [Deltaproteobacteria bacterium]|nr:hypothetical protein [Deltaproteobacteria bacterium]MCB9490389.1 hypothetical protein [Deltaproteobacteria bacterium]